MLKEELKDAITEMAHYVRDTNESSQYSSQSSVDDELDLVMCDSNLLGSLVDMLNAIPAQSPQMNEDFEDALEAIAYQKIKSKL
jgi:hypothetical protein